MYVPGKQISTQIMAFLPTSKVQWENGICRHVVLFSKYSSLNYSYNIFRSIKLTHQAKNFGHVCIQAICRSSQQVRPR